MRMKLRIDYFIGNLLNPSNFVHVIKTPAAGVVVSNVAFYSSHSIKERTHIAQLRCDVGWRSSSRREPPWTSMSVIETTKMRKVAARSRVLHATQSRRNSAAPPGM